MNKKFNTMILILGLLLAVIGLGYFRIKVVPVLNQQAAEREATLQATSPQKTVATASAQSTTRATFSPEVMAAVRGLSVRQKIAQLVAYPVEVTNTLQPVASESGELIAAEQPGFITLFGNRISTTSAEKTTVELRTLYPASALTPVIAVDHEGGSVQRLNGRGFTVLPSWSLLCQSPPAEVTTVLQESAAELANVGVDLVFGPVTDTVASRSAALAARSCGSSLAKIEPYVAIWLEAMSRAGVGSVLKHYPNLGELDADLHDQFATVSASVENETWMAGQLQKSQAVGVMTSHAGQVPNQNLPCSQSPECLKQLRASSQKLFFSDGLEMAAAKQRPGQDPANSLTIAVAALTAGNDVLVYAPQPKRFFQLLLDGLELRYSNDAEFRQIVDEHLQRVVGYKLTTGKNK